MPETQQRTPTVGRTVIYQYGRLKQFPATVVRVLDQAGKVNLVVFTDTPFGPVEIRTRVSPGAPGEADTWHWPERS